MKPEAIAVIESAGLVMSGVAIASFGIDVFIALNGAKELDIPTVRTGLFCGFAVMLLGAVIMINLAASGETISANEAEDQSWQ